MAKFKIIYLLAMLVLGVVLGTTYVRWTRPLSTPKVVTKENTTEQKDFAKLAASVLPATGAQLPVAWGSLGPKLISLGVIDPAKFTATPSQKEILTKGSDAKIKIDQNNVQFVVNFLWAVGLAQKSLVYEEGPMGQQYKSQVANFASTGGWTLGKASATSYLSKYDLIPLTSGQQREVAEIAKNVYRPCCGNSTYFPDCNHGMAALAMIELMVANGDDEDTIYRNVLNFNAFWFPQTYLTTAYYFAKQGVAWENVDAKKIMGAEFSSGQGAAAIASKVGPLPGGSLGGSSCGA